MNVCVLTVDTEFVVLVVIIICVGKSVVEYDELGGVVAVDVDCTGTDEDDLTSYHIIHKIRTRVW